jgi:magnesium-transporting ATPase (P-type)
MLLAAICAALTFKFSFFSGNKLVGANGHVFQSVAATGGVLILVITVLIVAGCVVNIFNYKSRKKQLWIAVGLIFLSLLNIFLYYRKTTPGNGFIEGAYDLTALLSLAIPVLLILAARGIYKDQKLVKSADRLR